MLICILKRLSYKGNTYKLSRARKWQVNLFINTMHNQDMSSINTVFTDNDIYLQLYSDFCEKGEHSSFEFKQLFSWLFSPPKYSTVRLNQLEQRGSSSSITQLKNEIKKQNKNFETLVEIHPILSDLLIIQSKVDDDIVPYSDGKEVYVDLKCGVSVLRGAHIFAPGIIGAPFHLQAGDKVSVYSDVEGKCLKGRLTIFPGNKLFLGNGTMLMSRQDLFNCPNPSGIAVDLIERVSNCPSLRDLMGSNMYLQNLPSVVCGHVLDPQPNERILDMCASPGGKTTHTASLMKDQGILVALDKSKNKVEKLRATVANQGFQCVKCYLFDSRKSVDIDKIIEDFAPPFQPNVFDKILLDAPCSALGQRPQLMNKMTLKELNSYPFVQRKLLTAAAQLLKPGGTLVYSTCTLTMAENEGMVKFVLDNYPNLSLVHQTPHLGGIGLKGSGLEEEDRLKLQRFDHISSSVGADKDTIGFFIAKFIKKK